MILGSYVWILLTVCANWEAPPSGRSSLVTDVMTTYWSCNFLIASTICSGSCGSGAWGCPFFTAQKVQLRVQASPSIMKVAVPSAKHWVRLGQWALSQTVCNFRPRMSWPISRSTAGLSGLGLNHSGRLACSGTSPALFRVLIQMFPRTSRRKAPEYLPALSVFPVFPILRSLHCP